MQLPIPKETQPDRSLLPCVCGDEISNFSSIFSKQVAPGGHSRGGGGLLLFNPRNSIPRGRNKVFIYFFGILGEGGVGMERGD